MDLLKKVIISIPFFSDEQFKADVQKLIDLGYGINYIEVRFDYWKGDLLDLQIQNVAQYLRSNHMNMIFTYKQQNQEKEEYISIIQRLITHKPDYIDLDVDIIASILSELAESAIQNDVAIVYSYHNGGKTPSLVTISDLCEFFIQMLPKFSSNANHMLKMVFMATERGNITDVMDFCKRYGGQGFKLISFCMGELGKLSRIQSIFNGCAYTYAYIGNPTAPGQFHISEMYNYLHDKPIS